MKSNIRPKASLPATPLNGRGCVISNNTFTSSPPKEAIEAFIALANAASENAQAIQAAARLFSPTSMLHIETGTQT